MKWPTVKLGDTCHVIAGGTPKRSELSYWGGEIPWVKISDMLQGRITHTEECITKAGLDESAAKLLPNGTLLVSIFATIGRTAVLECEAATNQAIVGVIPKSEEQFDHRFLEYSLQHKTSELQQKARGVAQSNINGAVLKATELPLPPLMEQKRIAGILDAADALRAKRRAALAELDALLQSTFLDLFGDPVTNPMGWEVVPLKELLSEKAVNGAYYPQDAYSDAGIQMVHMADAFYGVVDLRGVKRVNVPDQDIEKYRLTPSDILVSRRSLNYEGSAKPCLIPESDEPLIFESSLIRIRPDSNKVLTIYLYHYLQNDRARSKYVFPLVTRSTISGINQTNLMKVAVLVPRLSCQQDFAATVDLIDRQKERMRSHLAELDTLFASLQSRAFNGEL